MGRKLRGIVGVLKDKASLSKATIFCSSTAATASPTTVVSPQLAVLRATTHHPSGDPPHPRHIHALLAYGHGSRLAAGACVDALIARLCSTRDPSVALKSLLAVHHVVSRGAFILRDQLSAALLPSSGRRNPLNLSAFRHGSSPESWALSGWVRWYARVLELLLAGSRILGSFPDHVGDHVKGEASEERVTSLLNEDLLRELDALVALVEEIFRSPDASDVEGNGLVAEAVRFVEEDRLTAEREALVRVKEMRARLGLLRFVDSVELVCLLRRLKDCRDRPSDGNLMDRDSERFWSEVRSVMKMAEEEVLRAEEEVRGRKAIMVRRDRVGESARTTDRLLLRSVDPILFGSTRWLV